MTTETLTSKAGLKTAVTGTLAGVAATWLLGSLTATAAVVVGMVVLVAVAAAAYLAGVRAGGAARDGE